MIIKKIATIVLCLTSASCMLFGCTSDLAQKNDDAKTVAITMLYTEKLENVEVLIEDKFSDIDFQWERSATSSFNSDLKRRMDAGHGPDLVVSTQPADSDSERYVLPLGGYAFSSQYESTLIKGLSVDDMVYYLPFPGQYYGYVVNKTMFDENDIPMPTTNSEFVEALNWFKSHGIGVSDTGYVFGFRDMGFVSLGNFLVGNMVPDFLGTADGVKWLADYDDRKALMAGSWEPAFDLFNSFLADDLMNVGVYSKQGNSPNDVIYMSEGNQVAAYGYSSFLEECQSLNEEAFESGLCNKYEYVMLPFMGRSEGISWTIAMPSAYVGINAELAESENERKLDACRRILELLSTDEGQKALMADTRTCNSYLKGFNYTESLPSGLTDVVNNGYVYNVKFPGKVIEYLGKEASLFLGGKIEVADCLTAVDDYYMNGSVDVDEDMLIVGSVAQDLIYQDYNSRLCETALGNLVADGVASVSDCPIAVVNGGGIRASLYGGDVRNLDLKAVCPYDNQIVVVEMNGAVLFEMMENSLSGVRSSADVPGGRFLQVSGIKYSYDSTKPAGQRLMSVCLSDGTPVEDNNTYKVAINNYMAGKNGYAEGNGDGYTMLNLYSDDVPLAEGVKLITENLGTYHEALQYYFEQHKSAPVESEVEGRIVDVSKDLNEEK